MQTVKQEEMFCFPCSFPRSHHSGNYLLTRRCVWLASWKLCNRWGETTSGTVDSFDATLRFSNLVRLDGSSAHIWRGWKQQRAHLWMKGASRVAIRAEEHKSKHLAHMHTQALRVFASDENWQWSLCNDYSSVGDPLLLWQPSSQTSNIRPWQRAKRSSWITDRV